MNTKNGYKGLFLLMILSIFSSCTDFLKEEPKENLSLGQYYKTAFHAQSAVNELYKVGVPTFYDAGVYNGARIGYGGSLSGLYDNEYKGQEVLVQYCQELTISPSNITNEMTSVWASCYAAIGRANTAAKYLPEIKDASITDDRLNALLGEVLFFRGLNYFSLVKMFGDVPLILDPYESLDGLYLARTASSEVYAQIIKDLQVAVNTLPNEAFVKNGFRPSRTTAQAVLANVYLQMSGYPLRNDHYKDAASLARSVIKGGKHSLTPHENLAEKSAYNTLRVDDNLSEYLFCRERSATIAGYQSRWTQLSFPVFAAAWGTFKYTLTNNAIRPMPTIIQAYDPERDLRIQERQFFFTEYENQKGEMTKFEHPSPWFYLDQNAMFNSGVSGKNFPILRYAEVLLVAAEAIAQSEGVTAEAVGYLVDVRARAYTKTNKDELVSSLAALSKDAFVEEIWGERIREFSLEFKLWDDVLRTRMYPVTSSDAKGKVSFVNVVGAKNPWGATFSEKHLLWPISNIETQRNPELTQNPGYE